jgi:hypothetical protein
MAIRRIKLDYDVYPPGYEPETGSYWTFRTLTKAKRKARGLGAVSMIYRNFNQQNKRNTITGGWWGDKRIRL